MKRLIAQLWRAINGQLQWRILWLGHAKFIAGVTGIVRDDAGRVLLLKHRLWPADQQWGLPGGYAKAGEQFTATVAREVREEVGLEVEVRDIRPVRLRSGYQLRIEVAYEAHLVGGEINVDGFEIEEACWFDVTQLPAKLMESHRALILRETTVSCL